MRQEEDANFDGAIDKRTQAGGKGAQTQEADSNGDGRIDTWITTDAQRRGARSGTRTAAATASPT